MRKRLQVFVWSDIACPWCYVGKRRFEAALASFEHAADVEVTWKSFELDPSAPRVRPIEDYAQRLAAKYGQTRAQAQGRIDQLVEVARAEGITLDFKRIQPGNTFDAHRLLHLARAHGLHHELKERLLRAYLSEGRPIGEHDTLLSAAQEVGLDVDAAQALLATDQYATDVRRDEEEARQLGISGVPCFVLAQRYAVEGAQPVAHMRLALERAYAEVPALTSLTVEEGAVCGPDGCEPTGDAR
ncbi:MAG TPA: DsbA family oxidoreductase [Polyangiales bacterium]|nr:DsbA family oxidoreductase [Polyangiales bacterium]